MIKITQNTEYRCSQTHEHQITNVSFFIWPLILILKGQIYYVPRHMNNRYIYSYFMSKSSIVPLIKHCNLQKVLQYSRVRCSNAEMRKELERSRKQRESLLLPPPFHPSPFPPPPPACLEIDWRPSFSCNV